MTITRVAGFVGSFADIALRLAHILLDLASHFLGLVAGDFAGCFFQTTLDLVLGAFRAILVHDPCYSLVPDAGNANPNECGVMRG